VSAPGSASSRRTIRRAAVQAIFQLDAGGEEPDLDTIRGSLAGAAGEETEHEEAWTLALAAWADRGRAILRIAAHEMLVRGVPAAVVIDEAVELAREFSTAESPRFVHGVLEGIRKQVERERAPAADAGL
jgi:transcription termination factor NusB